MAIIRILALAALAALLGFNAVAAEEMNSAGPAHATSVFSRVRSDQDLSSVEGQIAFTWETDI